MSGDVTERGNHRKSCPLLTANQIDNYIISSSWNQNILQNLAPGLSEG